VVPEKRKLMVVGAAIAVAFALPGCAPAGYNASDYKGGTQPAAQEADATPEPTDEPTGEPTGEPTAEPTASGTAEAGGKLSEDDITSELTGTTVKRMGKVVVDQEGWVLYRFDGDKAKPESKATCNGDCARTWPPALTEDGKPELKGIDATEVGTVTRADGSKQLTIGKWPVYRYAGDKKPGQWKGQNVGGKWFVISNDGTKNITCLPPVSKPIAPPADDSDDSGDASGNAGGADYSY
jgi:predicted lipoprotein with Yx(FWY)xxD motif